MSDRLGRHYILDRDHHVVPADLLTWAKFFEDRDKCRVAETFTSFHRVSTVFLGLDHQWDKGPPLVFETMVFERQGHEVELTDGQTFIAHDDVETWRYSSWADAVDGHNSAVRRMERLEAASEVTALWDRVKQDIPD